jgi:UDP-glucose 4-epimerase
MRVLITGGLGFIGCNLAIRCLSYGWEVVIVDNGKTENHLQRKKIILQKGSPKIYNTNLKNFLITSKYKNFDVVFHLAALPSVLYSVEEPYKSFKNNVDQTTLMMLTEANETSKIGRIVFASSAAIYGNNVTFPTLENSTPNPESPYGLHKLMGEQLLKLNCKYSNIDAVSLRYFNVYGPYQYNTGPYATAVSAWLQNIKNNLPLRKDGTGEQSRDMVYVEDIVSANILAAQYPNKLNGECFNIASGSEISNNQILDLLAKRFSFNIQQAPFRAGDIMRTCPSIEKAKSILGYKPEYAFETGLEHTINSLFK